MVLRQVFLIVQKLINFIKFKREVDSSRPLIIEDEQYVPSRGWAEIIKKVYEVDPLIFILGEMLGLNSIIGSKILEISKDNYRQKLSRARKKVYAFLKGNCGLINKSNPCHCEKKQKHLSILELLIRIIFSSIKIILLRIIRC